MSSDTPSDLPGRLRAVMRDQGLCQQDLATMLGVTQQGVSYWLNGNPMKKGLIELACSKLGIRQEWLMHGKGDREAAPSIGADLSVAAVVLREDPAPYGASIELLAARLAGQAASFASESNAARRMRWTQLELEFNSLKTAWTIQVEKGRAIRAAQSESEKK